MALVPCLCCCFPGSHAYLPASWLTFLLGLLCLRQVHLEVGYKAKISAGRTVLCTTEVESIEGRKLWMKATVRWAGRLWGHGDEGGQAGVHVAKEVGATPAAMAVYVYCSDWLALCVLG